MGQSIGVTFKVSGANEDGSINRAKDQSQWVQRTWIKLQGQKSKSVGPKTMGQSIGVSLKVSGSNEYESIYRAKNQSQWVQRTWVNLWE